MEWVKVTTESVRSHMAVELIEAYDKWIVAYPEKAGRLDEIVANVRTEFRDAIASVPRNRLNEDPETLPVSAVRHCENICMYEMAMEVGVQITQDGRTLLTNAQIYLRQIPYGRYRFYEDEEDTGIPLPSATVPGERQGRALGPLVALFLGFFLWCLPVRAAWIKPGDETTYIPVNYDITEQSLGGHLAGIDNAIGWLSDTNGLYGRLVGLPQLVYDTLDTIQEHSLYGDYRSEADAWLCLSQTNVMFQGQVMAGQFRTRKDEILGTSGDLIVDGGIEFGGEYRTNWPSGGGGGGGDYLPAFEDGSVFGDLFFSYWVNDQNGTTFPSNLMVSGVFVARNGIYLGGEYRTTWPESGSAPAFVMATLSPVDYVTITGIVQAVYSDAEQNTEENIRFDTNFPASRLEWEDWRGAVRYITTGADGYTGTFDAAPPECVTNGCCFYVDGEEPPIARFIAAMGETFEFSPALKANETYSVSSIRGAVCDSYGLHAGAVTDNDLWMAIQASPTLGNNYPALACSADGRIVFKTASGQTVWRSRDGGDAWEQLAASPTLGNNYPALACSADGRIVFKTAFGQTVWRSTPTFGTLSRTAYTVLVDAVPRVVEKIRDYYAVDRGEQRAFWALRTGGNRYSVYDTGTDPIGWHDIAWESDGTWYIRTTNGPAATTATTAPEAVSAAAEAWSRNLALEWQYQPHYGYSRFDGGTNVEWALTFMPDEYASTNAPAVSGMGVLCSAFGDTPHWDTGAFRIDIVATNPTVSKVIWAGDVPTHATIYYTEE